jgi:hypothetical protein
MRAETFWRLVTAERNVPFCVVGGQGANAYVEPVVSLDLDLAIALEDGERVEQLMRDRFTVERSDLRVQFRSDPRYAEFVPRASQREVLGIRLPVARADDVLRGKVWAAGDPTRRPSKRQKDLADIARLLEAFPEMRAMVPAEILARLV